MTNDADYDALLVERSRKRAEYQACESRIDECDYLLRRLRTAKEEIVAQKAAYRKLIKTEQGIIDQKYAWKGESYDSYCRNANEVQRENAFYLNYSLDRALDTLNNRITEIENKRLREFGLLGQLASALNYLSNSIENFFN